MSEEVKEKKANIIRQFVQLTNKLFLLETKRQETSIDKISEKREIIKEEKEILIALNGVFKIIKKNKPAYEEFVQRVQNITGKKSASSMRRMPGSDRATSRPARLK